jgi:CubicO group peptidase (beta-lactamase class C family)
MRARSFLRRVWRCSLSLVVLVPVLSAPPVAAAAQQAGIDAVIAKYRAQIPRLIARQGLPGLAIVVVDERGVVWVEGFGYTDRDHAKAVTPDTIFAVQSTSKTFTAAAVLLAVQAGLLDLDVPITTYLPDFTIHSIFEEHPERKITLRHLLSHTAGLAFDAPVGNNYDLGSKPFEDHMRSISETWLRFPVGTGYAYSNMGYSLAGYILQTVTRQPFEQYVEKQLLHPLGMMHSTFERVQIRASAQRAVGHTRPFPAVPLDIPILPEGGLYASAHDMARFVRFLLGQGSLDGWRLLDQALFEEMVTVPFPVRGQPEGYALGLSRARREDLRNADLEQH